jgi:hypothetical protein
MRCEKVWCEVMRCEVMMCEVRWMCVRGLDGAGAYVVHNCVRCFRSSAV